MADMPLKATAARDSDVTGPVAIGEQGTAMAAGSVSGGISSSGGGSTELLITSGACV